MKTKLVLAAVFVSSLPALGQEERPPETPRPPEAARPPQSAAPPRDEHRGEDRRPLGLPPADRPGSPESHRPIGPSPTLSPAPGHRFHGQTIKRPGPQKPTPYVGVVTSRVTPALGAQLGLGEGFGLVVDEVVPESPAAKAGVQRHDVLKLFEDQRLVDPNQLATLVRACAKETDVSLTLLRKGQEQKLTLRVGERMLPERTAWPLGDNLRNELHRLDGSLREGLRPLQEQTKRFQEKMRDFQARFREWQKAPNAGPPPEPPQVEPPPPPAPPFGPKPIDILREARPGGAAVVKSITNGNTRTWSTGDARVFVKDDAGEVEILSKNGQRHVTAKNARGEVTFTGPIDTDEQRRALPEEVRRRIERIDAQTALEREGSQASADSRVESIEESLLEREIQ